MASKHVSNINPPKSALTISTILLHLPNLTYQIHVIRNAARKIRNFSPRNSSDLAPSSAHDELGGCTMHLIHNQFVTIMLSHTAISCHQEVITIISPERTSAQTQSYIFLSYYLHMIKK